MPTPIGVAADFVIASDVSFDLQLGGDIDITLDFLLPPNTTLATSPGGTLAWNVRVESVGTVTYEIYINGEKQTTQTVSGLGWHTVRESFDTSILKLRPSINKIEFRIISGSARLSIGDVAIWFHKKIFSPSTEPGVLIPLARIAEFKIIKDKSFDLQQGGDIDGSKDFALNWWSLEDNCWLLTWNVRTESSGTVTYEVRVNDTTVTTQSVNGPDWHNVQRALGPTVLKQGNNKVEVRVTGGGARLSIGDLTLWFNDALSYSVPL